MTQHAVAAGPGASDFDVVVLGEILVEVSTEEPFGHEVAAQLGVSGDALNVAAAAAAAGARVAILAVLTDDDLGDAIAHRVAALGIDTSLLIRRAGQQGCYLVHGDPNGEREFSYARQGSVGSTLCPADLPRAVLGRAGAVVASGIGCAISATAAAAILESARIARRFVYDPNFRPRLTTAASAREMLQAIAPLAWLVTPSFPAETEALLDVTSARAAADALRTVGSEMVAVTCGSRGVHLVGTDGAMQIEPVPAPTVVDQTGAGDAYLGTLTARLVLGDDLHTAGRVAAGAASLVVGGRGGTGLVPTYPQSLAHLAAHSGGAA